MLLLRRLSRRSFSQQLRPHGTKGQLVVSRHATSSRRTTPVSAADRAREEKEENERWAKQSEAREILAQPPFDVDRKLDAQEDMCHSLEDYLKARRWLHPDGPARRFLSHLLTYPLTLAAGLHEVGLSSAPLGREVFTPVGSHSAGAPGDGMAGMPAGAEAAAAGGHQLSVVCIGARAESTLPPDFWRETLFALPGVSRLDLHLLGPELGVPPGVAASATTIGGHRGYSRPGGVGGGRAPSPLPGHPTTVVSIGDRTVEIRWIRALLDRSTGECVEVGRVESKGLGTEAAEAGMPGAGTPGAGAGVAAAAAVAAAEDAIEGADAFVLFNPGLGHPHLREGWEGAAKRLLASGKPIIVSCHSRQDLKRDERQLRAIGEGWGSVGAKNGDCADLFSRENAFGSQMKSEDPVPSVAGAEEIVSNNWGLLIVRANR